MSRSSPSADRAGRRHTRLIVIVAAFFYALCLAVAWQAGRVWVDRKSEALLRDSRVRFTAHLEELIHSVQWSQAVLAMDALGGYTNATAHSVAEMQAVAARLYIDELNIVSTNGRVIASNLAKVVGDDWRLHPATAAFLELLDPASKRWRLAQPFRHGSSNPEFYCAYFAVAFDDRSGILELGYTMDRLVQVMSYSDAERIGEWKIGRHGHFSAIDADGDRVVDLASTRADGDLPPDGVVCHLEKDGERATELTFAFAGRLFSAVVPDREFGEQRTMAFVVFAFTSAVLVLLFALILLRLVRAARKVAALHREAEERTAADMAVARQIQLSSLPEAATFLPDDLSFELAAASHPARDVGGDYYDFFRAPDGRIAFLVADVSGKGVPAALFMHEAKHAFAEALRTEGGLAAAVVAMNDWLCANNEAEMFVTAWFGLLDSATGALEYVNAGHNRPYLLASSGEPVVLAERGGRFIGMFPGATYRATRRTLEPGDRIVLYTDGVTEAMNAHDQPFGDRRFAELLATHPADVLTATTDAVAAHVAGAEASDDLTLLVLTWRGRPETVSQTFAVDAETAGSGLAFLQHAVTRLDRKRKARLLNAADELIANVVSYSGAHALTIDVAATDGRTCVVLTDDGMRYNPLAHRDPNTHLTLEDRPEGGLGILMAKRLVSFVAWTHGETGNRTTLVQKAVER